MDADSPEAAAALEARSPACAAAPCEVTRRGLHFYFRRSRHADEAGFFDGCAQRTHGVDFKSVSAGGVSGIILVAPSTDKRWLPSRALWDEGAAPDDIGDDLLEHVAAPRGGVALAPQPTATTQQETQQQTRGEDKAAAESAQAGPLTVATGIEELCLTFDDEAQGSLRVRGAWLELLKSTGYIGAGLSGRWRLGADAGGVPTLRVPGTAAGVSGLLDMLEKGELPAHTEPTDVRLASIDEAADALGLPPDASRRVRVPSLDERSRATFHSDLYALRPSWWRACRDEEALMLGHSPAASDAALVPIDRALAKRLRYEPISKAAHPDLWLFADLPHRLHPKSAGTPVLAAEPETAMLRQLPPAVAALLKAHRSCLALAGGAVLGGVSMYADRGTDLDLFVFGLSAADSAMVLADIEAYIKANHAGEYVTSRSSATVTFGRVRQPGTARQSAVEVRAAAASRPFQVILGTHRVRSQILEYFDVAPTKALARFNAAGDFIVEAMPAFVEALRAMAFWVDLRTWSPAAPGRICKYVSKGFECAAPGVRRGAFAVACGKRSLFPRTSRANWNRTSTVEQEEDYKGLLSKGLGVLFDAEAEVLRCRRTPDKDFDDLGGVVQIIRGRLCDLEAATLAHKISGTLGLGGGGGGGGGTKSYGYIRELFRRGVAVQLGDERRGAAREVADVSTSAFNDFKPWDPTVPGRFIASAPHLDALHDADKFEAVAAAEVAARAERAAAVHWHLAGACGACGKPGARNSCMGCSSVVYCGRECQGTHWRLGHRGVCKALGPKPKA